MRFGLVGTSFWAREIHAKGIQAAADAELVGVWGRDPAKAAALATDAGCKPFEDFSEMLEAVDAVAFSVPPYVQSELATEAANAGKHLLLEKPTALSVDDSARLRSAVEAAGVASVVFFTARFTPERRDWSEWMRANGPWRGATMNWRASAFAPGSPFDTPWRRDKGALWDIGPHIVAAMTDGLGPVVDVLAAARGAGDLIYFVLQHEGGATSSISATLAAPADVAGTDTNFWSEKQVVSLPDSSQSVVVTHATAVRELIASAARGQPHDTGVAFGDEVVQLLARVEELAG